MRYVDYLRLDGACSATLGVALIALGWPGLLGDGSMRDGLLASAVVLLIVAASLAVLAMRRGIPLRAPGRWLTDRSIARAGVGGSPMPAAALRRRLTIETALWIVGVGAWVILTGRDATLIWATGWGTLAYGLLQVLGSARRAAAVEAERHTTFFVARRPGLGTPELTTPA